MDKPVTTPRRAAGVSLAEWVKGLPEVFSSDARITNDVSRASRANLVRRVAARIYTSNMGDSVEDVVAAHALRIAALRHPGAVLSHRSALEMAPGDGHLFLTGNYEATDRLPGLTIRLIRGCAPQADDNALYQLFRASDARACLENLRRTRSAGGVSRVLPRAEVERRLETLLRQRGEAGLNDLRDRARELAPTLGTERAFAALDTIIAALLTTGETKLTAPTALARADGLPYDEAHLALFDVLMAELRQNWADTSRPAPPLLREERQNLAFIDSYFSSFIEGTEFGIAEAKRIVFEDDIPAERPADAHDVKGTFELLVDDKEMLVSAAAFDLAEDFEELVQRRHRIIMAARPERRPGQYKKVANRAGATWFVEPSLVRGTLVRAFQQFAALETGFQRAVFLMFVISEVHPFDDGNGRLARAMMNAELAAAEQTRITIVTAYRDDYLGALRRLSRERDPTVYVRMLDRAQELVSRLRFADLDQLVNVLHSCNAFDDTGRKVMKLPKRP